LRFLLISFLAQIAAEGLDTSVLPIIPRSGLVAKGVLILLLFFSIVSWAIIADKYFSFRRARRQNGHFYRTFRKTHSLGELAGAASRYRHSPFAKMFLIVYNEITHHLPTDVAGTAATIKGMPPPISYERIDRAVSKAGLSETSALEKNLSFLATTASATPFIGLFGTVWGIINSFESIGAARSTDLSVVAPGIAEALIATAMGLAAAIPAVIGYNYFIHKIRDLTSEMEEFSIELQNLVEGQHLVSK
jgi:biopolymer transport protein TolQ